jgi:hypothetical protein
VRVQGLEKHQAPLSVRWIYGYVRRIFGRDLTPVKVLARVPRIFWGSALLDAFLRRAHRVDQRLKSLAELRAAARVGCPF